MNRLLLAAAALALAVTTGPAMLGQAQAAPAAKAAECSNAARMNDASWQEHYHCWNNGQATAPTVPVAAKPAPSTKSPECSNTARMNDASWQEHYHCWK
jgi:nitrous oxide reductase